MDLLPDSDIQETQAWIESLNSVIETEGTERAHFLIEMMIDQARRSGSNLPYNATTALPSVSPQCAIEFCASDGQWEIHTSCSYDLYIGQAYGPQQDVIIAGYCLSDNVSFAEFLIICLCQHLVMSLFSLSLSLSLSHTQTSFQTHFIE